ncbi:hypothetical protein L6164_023046 [Bauhinia variegata]|uniref:Uncharacterized protein n=1 Tax=Bauhinia variegata TaxID=167791 RepID=A0ACB9MH30_BAUVA|nr:hypothetical protein L6164_023046 [Bauhinia variegata]
MLTHAASSVHPQDLSPSIRCFNPRPLSRTFRLYPLVLRSGRSPNKLVDVNLHREAKSRSYHVVVVALAAEVEVAEGVGPKEGVDRVYFTAMGIRFQKILPLYAGNLCKIDSEGKARKVIGCSCVFVKTEGLRLRNRIEKKAAYLQELEEQVSISPSILFLTLYLSINFGNETFFCDSGWDMIRDTTRT